MSPQVQIKPWLHCRPLSAVFCCLYSALGPPLAGARCQIRPWLPSRPLFVNCCCFLLSCSLQRTPLAGARCHRRYRSSLGSIAGLFPLFFVVVCTAHWAHLLLELDVTVAILAQGTDQALFLSIAAASCCLAPCSAHLLLELDVTAGTDQALAPLPASFCCFLLSLQRTGPTSCWS